MLTPSVIMLFVTIIGFCTTYSTYKFDKEIKILKNRISELENKQGQGN